MHGINLLESKCGIVKIEPLFPNKHIEDKYFMFGCTGDNDIDYILTHEDHHISLDILEEYAIERLTDKDFDDDGSYFYCPRFKEHLEKCSLCKENLRFYKTHLIL